MTDAEIIEREVARLDKRIDEIRDEYRNGYRELRGDLNESLLESNTMSGEMKRLGEAIVRLAEQVQNSFNELKQKKMRGVDIALIIMVAVIGFGSFLAQIQNNQIQKELIKIAQGVTK